MRLQHLFQEQAGLEPQHRDPSELRRGWTTLSSQTPGQLRQSLPQRVLRDPGNYHLKYEVVSKNVSREARL